MCDEALKSKTHGEGEEATLVHIGVVAKRFKEEIIDD